MDIGYVLELFKELEIHLKKYGDSSVAYQYRTLVDAISVLEADYTDEEKEECIVKCYKRLYPERSGLTEFFIWNSDFEQRKALNEPLEHISDELWRIVKDRMQYAD